MPYKEIGKEYPFTSPTKVPMNFVMEKECLSGFVGYQSYAGTTTVNINAIDLEKVKVAIESKIKVATLFMKLSWNEDVQITDLVFGAVWITGTNVSAQQVLNAVPSDLMKVLTDLRMIERQDFDAYIDGSVSYEHVWDWSGETREAQVEVVRSIGWPKDPFPFDQVKNACKVTILAETTAKLQTELAAYSPIITKIEPLVEIITTYSSRQYRDYTEVTYRHTLKMSAKVYFTTQKPLATSPLALSIIAALTKIIISIAAIIVTALVVYYAWAIFIKSFLVRESKVTTKTTTITKTPIFDEENNIIGYEEVTIIEEKEEWAEEPDWMGQLMVVAIIGVAIVGAAIIVPPIIGAFRKRD